MNRYSVLCLTAAFQAGLFLSSARAQTVPAAQPPVQKKHAHAREHMLDNHRTSTGLVKMAQYKLEKARLEAAGLSPQDVATKLLDGPQMAFPYAPYYDVLKAQGTVKTLTVLVDFKDHRADVLYPKLPLANIKTTIYGPVTPTVEKKHFPYESLNAYYKRASESKNLNIKGDVLGWHHFPEERESYKPVEDGKSDDELYNLRQEALFGIITTALKSFEATHDFKQYDNDKDGDIDLVNVIYAGPGIEGDKFWWAYQWHFDKELAKTETVDGKRLDQFIFQYMETREDGTDFWPNTLIHETGHGLGLADYYDGDEKGKPQGAEGAGLGGLDMMDSCQGNHNAFSRWLLDWIQPAVIGKGSSKKWSLVASGSNKMGVKALAVFPDLKAANAPKGELFLVENRQRVGNDKDLDYMPNDGLLIWHVMANVNAYNDGFLYDNTTAEKKLIQLVRADCDCAFQMDEFATSDVYFNQGKEFTSVSVPSSQDAEGKPTDVSVTDISTAAEVMAVRVGYAKPGPPPGPAPSPAGSASALTPNLAVETATDLPAAAPVPAPAPDEPVGLEEIEAVVQKAGQASAEELKAMWLQAAKKAETRQLKYIKTVILSHWAAKSGEEAVKSLLAKEGAEFVKFALPKVMVGWVQKSPKDALKWYLKERANPEMSRGLLADNPEFAREAFTELAKSDIQTVSKQLDDLVSVKEIAAALEGLEEAREITGASQKKLESALDNLSKNNAVVRVLRNTQELKALKEAIQKNFKNKEDSEALQQAIQQALER